MERLTAGLADRYRVDREIGRGGMAHVFLAHDLKLDRPVALKVLRPDLAAVLGGDRFLREITLAAKLEHPHILAIHDSGEADGVLYYVMPFVEGESLRGRLDREKQLPLNDALQIAREVADALSYAHARGVIHRDIKPENILLEAGHAVVADFGIARAIDAAGGERLTETGVTLGTPAYMSPEQAGGTREPDGRSDLYSLGCVLYEMLAGKAPFTGPTVESVIKQHLTAEPPDVTAIRPAVPADVAGVLARALAKIPADRFSVVGGFVEALARRESAAVVSTPTLATPPAHRGWRRPALLGVTVAAMVAVAVVVARWPPLGGSDGPTLRAGRTQRLTRVPGLELDPAFAPDGRTVAYAAGFLGDTHIYVSQIGGGTISLTEGVPGAQRSPRWSPDGTQIAFESQGAIYLVPALGGPPRRLVGPRDEATSGFAFSHTWSPDGSQIAYVWQEGAPSVSFQRHSNAIYAIPTTGGEPRKIADAEEAHSLRWSPDGSTIAYVSGASLFVFGTSLLGNVDPSAIWVVPAAGGQAVRVTDGEFMNVSPVWMPGGQRLLFVSNRAGSRDVYHVRVIGSGEPVGVPTRLTTGLDVHTIDFSPDPMQLVYSVLSHTANVWTLAIPTRGTVSVGEAQPVTTEAQTIEMFEVSPDGRWLVFDSNREGNQDIYTAPLIGGVPQRLTSHPADDYAPTWSQDGREIFFYSLRTGNRDVFLVPADGGSERQLTDDPAQDRLPAISPSGNELAFASDRTGRHELYLIRRSSRADWGAPAQLTSEGGTWPRWSPDGSEIVYRSDPDLSLRVYSLGRSVSRTLVRDADLGLTSLFGDWSPRGDAVYLSARSRDGTTSVWSAPIAGGAPRQLVRFDDPKRGVLGLGFRVRGQQLFFVLQQFESDISVMELSRAR